MKQYDNRSVKDVCAEDFSTTPLEYVVEYCLGSWGMTVEQLLTEIYGQYPDEQIEYIEESVADHLRDNHGYVWEIDGEA